MNFLSSLLKKWKTNSTSADLLIITFAQPLLKKIKQSKKRISITIGIICRKRHHLISNKFDEFIGDKDYMKFLI